MARMIPPCISKDVISTGEKQLFELFKKAPHTEDWVVLHSLCLAKHVKRLYGEIDFLVMAPKLGIFCLEVKGGEIGRKEGQWKHTNRYGEVFNVDLEGHLRKIDGLPFPRDAQFLFLGCGNPLRKNKDIQLIKPPSVFRKAPSQ